jgi:hypothetical protein
MTFEVEKEWITTAGFRAVVTMGFMGFRCGYVGIPVGHPLYGIDYGTESDALAELPEGEPLGKRGIIPVLCASIEGRIPRSPEMTFDVHGGITYSGGRDDYPVTSDLWWFGYARAASLSRDRAAAGTPMSDSARLIWRKHVSSKKNDKNHAHIHNAGCVRREIQNATQRTDYPPQHLQLRPSGRFCGRPRWAHRVF